MRFIPSSLRCEKNTWQTRSVPHSKKIERRELEITLITSLLTNHILSASNYRFCFRGVGTRVIPVRGRRFASACCAAQSVIRRGPCCAVPSHWLALAAQIAAPQRASSITRVGEENEDFHSLIFNCRQANHVVRPNWALNRTYCGGPAFGLQKPSPNTSPPQ